MGFLSKLFGGGEKPTEGENQMQTNNPTADLEAIRDKNAAEAAQRQEDRVANLQAGASEAGVAPSADKYGQNSPATPEQSAPAAKEADGAEDQKAA